MSDEKATENFQHLKEIVSYMLISGYSPNVIRHEIVTSDCRKEEKQRLLQKLHLE